MAIRSTFDHILFQTRLRPHALAVFGPAGPIAYHALVRDVDALATELRERDLTAQDMVGLHLGLTYLHVLLILALDRLGIPSMSFVTGAGAPAVLPQFGLTAIISGNTAPADPSCRWIEMAEQHRPKLGQADEARLGRIDSGIDVGADPLLRIIWSSGTTGGAKGAPLSRTIQARRLALRRLLHGIGPHTRAFAGVPLSTPPGYLMALGTLSAGGALVLPSPTVDFFSLADALGITETSATPAMLADLVGQAAKSSRRLDSIACLEVVGEQLPGKLAGEAQTHLTPNIWIDYGTSETGRIAAAEVGVGIADANAVGFVIPWIEAEIVDGTDRPVPAGQEGILRVRGEQVIAGYYKDDAATRRNFRAGWFYPGDVGAITADGVLRITGRIEDVIVRGGVSLSPLPIEDAIRSLPQVRDVAVFPLDGAVGQDICAALVLEPGTDPRAVGAAAAARLGDRTPTRLFVVERLPRNANGKVQRRTLAEWARGGGQS